ncbi:hypothetical protein PIB30_075328, partial [Stylosanthes scabra]|nr:hypothetical protein [Stylosanthes scabra]
EDEGEQFRGVEWWFRDGNGDLVGAGVQQRRRGLEEDWSRVWSLLISKLASKMVVVPRCWTAMVASVLCEREMKGGCSAWRWECDGSKVVVGRQVRWS